MSLNPENPKFPKGVSPSAVNPNDFNENGARMVRSTIARALMLGLTLGLTLVPWRLAAQTSSDFQIANKVFDSTNLALKINVVANGNPGGGAPDFPNLSQVFNRAYDSTNTALKVNCVVGCSGGQNTVTFSATPTFDASKGSLQTITLTGNVTSSTLSNAVAGQTLDFKVCQDATGGRLFVWPANVKNAAPVPAAANACLTQAFIYDGTNANAVASAAPATASQTAQTAAISAVTLATPQSAGIYLVSVFVHVTTSDASGKTVTGTVGWTDGGVALSKSTSAVAVASTGNFDMVVAEIHADANTAITYSTSVSGSFTSAQYRVDARLSM